MKHFFYGIIIRTYYLACLIVSLFHWKAKKWIEGRQNWQNKLKTQLISNRPKIWIYCPSIGEFQECRKFVHRITEEKRNFQFVYTFHSPSGYDQAKIPGENPVRLQLPIDTKKNAKKFIDIVEPKEMYVLASGIWLNYVSELQKRNIPHHIISFYGRSDSVFFRPSLNFFYKPLFSSFETIFCYNENCKELLKKHFDYNKAVVVGNLRFDCVLDMKKELRPIKGIKEFVNDQFCFVAGSTEDKEDEILVKAYNKLKHLPIKWIIVPHEKLKNKLNWYQKVLGNEMCFYSKSLDFNKNVLIYDVTGDLFHLYDYANICLVGRGFHRLEIHNMLEPAVFLKPVIIGPKHKKFVEPKLFIQHKLAFEFNNTKELNHLIKNLYSGKIQVDKNAINKIFQKYSNGTEIVLKTLITSCSKTLIG